MSSRKIDEVKSKKKVRKFESLGYHVRKCELHIKFLDICHYLNVTQTFYDSTLQIKN